MGHKINNNSEDIIFFSLHYPYAFADSYLDEEINLLSEQCGKLVVITNNTYTEHKRDTPAKAIVYRFSANEMRISRAKSLSLLLYPFFYKEIISAHFKYGATISFRLIKEVFAFYARAIVTKEFIERVVKEQHLNTGNLLIYTYWMLEGTFASVLLKKNTPSVKVISKAHSQDVYFFRTPFGYQPFRKYIFDRLSHLYFISENARNYFIEKHRLTASETAKISISRIGIVGHEPFVGGRNDNELRIISVAYIQKLKRVELIIDALSLISDIRVKWYHVGQADSTEYFNWIKNYAREKLSPNPNITFVFTGQIAKPELFQIYSESKFDLLMSLSETEGIPVSMMEAMSYSVPVMGTNVGGVAEIIKDEENGFLLRPDVTALEIATGLRNYFLMNAAAKNNIRLNAYNTWMEKYNSGKNYAEFVKSVLSL